MALIANVVLVVLSGLLGFRLVQRYSARPRPHTLWYAVGLLLLGAAALPEVYRELAASLPTILWWLYWSAASATVGFLAVGTAYLLSPRAGKFALGGAAVLSLWVVIATVVTAGPTPAELTAEAFAKAPTGAIKLPFLLQNIIGSLVILGGALWSFIRTRAWYNVWIALGTLVFAAGGTSSGLLKYSDIFYFTQTAGIALLYLGVSQSIAPEARAAHTRAPGM